MRFQIVGEITATASATRAIRKRLALHCGIELKPQRDITATEDYDAELCREYPATITLGEEVSKEQLAEIVLQCELWPSDTETMGTLGGPSYPGWAPAIAFNVESMDCFGSIYVTPIPEPVRDNGRLHDFDTVAKAVREYFRNV